MTHDGHMKEYYEGNDGPVTMTSPTDDTQKLEWYPEPNDNPDSIPGQCFEPTPSDPVFRPAHYTQFKGMEPLTFFLLNPNIPFGEASVCKYVLRWRIKNGIEDLRKARRIIDMLIEMEVNRSDYAPKKSCL